MKKNFTISFLLLIFSSANNLKAQWGLSADSIVLLNNGNSFGGGYVPFKYCSDDNNGVITTWVNGTHIYAQRVDANGYKKWGDAGIIIYDSTAQPLYPHITDDGHGGCYIIWVNYAVVNSSASFTYVGQRLDSLGNELWHHDGLQVIFPNASNNFGATNLDVLNDNGNGVFLGLEVGWYGGYGSVRAAKIDVNGKPVWDSSGVAVSVVGDYRGPKLLSDGFGGIEMIYWSDVSSIGNIHLQRIDVDGNLKWGAGGLGLNTLFTIDFPTYNISHSNNTDIIATWDGYLYHSGVYTQKIDTGGNFIWGPAEVKVCDTPAEQTYPDVISDGTGGAYFAWSDSRASGQPVRIYAQRLNTNGVEQWLHNGIAIDTLNTYNPNPSLAPDVNNGVRIFWPSSQNSYHTLMQRLDSTGNVICSPLGVRVSPLNTTTILYGNRSVLHRNNGGDLVLGYANYGLYVQYVPAGCNFPAAFNACDSLSVNFGFSTASALTQQFIDSSVAHSGNVFTWQWNFGDTASGINDTTSLQNPLHLFTSPGTYTVCLKITGGVAGAVCTDSICKQVIITAAACSGLAVNYGFSIASDTCQFTDSSTITSGTIQGWQWDFNDPASGTSDTSSLQNPVHVFSATGTYHVCLIVKAGVSGAICTDTICKEIVILTTGIPSLNPYSFNIFPNPAKDNFTLSCARITDNNIRLLINDIYGNTIKTSIVKNGNNLIDMAPFAAGLYFIKVIDSTEKIVYQCKIAVSK